MTDFGVFKEVAVNPATIRGVRGLWMNGVGDHSGMRMMSGAAALAAENRSGSSDDSREQMDAGSSEGLPIDLDYLSRQTLGDSDLQGEVLALFREQAASIKASIIGASGDERRRLAHGLRGSAGGIGALAIAHCAAEIENDPVRAEAVPQLLRLIDEALTFIDEIAR